MLIMFLTLSDEFKIDEKYYIKLHPHLDYISDLFKSFDNDYSNHSHQYITMPSNEILKINEQIQNESVFLAIDLEKNQRLTILAKPIWEIINSYNEKIKENKTNIDFIIKKSIDPLLLIYKKRIFKYKIHQRFFAPFEALESSIR